MFAGDFSIRDSMAWLAGSLCSGGLSVIPVVGWILGGLADIRDTIAGLIHGDWVGAGLSILGVVPYVGDAVAIPAKAAKFVARFVHRIDAVLRFIARYDKIPDLVKETALQLILATDWDRLVNDQPEALAFKGTAAVVMFALPAKFTKAGLTRLARGDRTDIRRLARAMYDPHHVPGPKVPFFFRPRDAEDYVADTLLAGTTGTKQFKIDTPGVPRPRSKHRKIDYAEQQPDGSLVLHEVKTGVSDYGSEVDQCEKDAWLMKNPNRPEGTVAGVVWHFMPHGRYNSLGPSEALLNCLITNGIKFTIHAPNI
jgi:hypothetical protein